MEILRRLRQAAARRPGKLVFMLLSLGISFGFIATIVAITHASWHRLPAGVAEGDYVTLGRRTASGVSRVALVDFENVERLAPEMEWLYQRSGTLSIRDPRGEVRRINAPRVSGRFFEHLGIDAAAGALTATREGTAAVLSHGFWRETFEGRADAVTEFLNIEAGMSVPIVGVADGAFEGIVGGRPDVWILDAPFDLAGPPERNEAVARATHRKIPSMHVFGTAKQEGALSVESLRGLFAGYEFDTGGVVERTSDGDQAGTRIYSWNVLATDRLIVTPGIETNPDRQRDVRQKLVWLVGIVMLLLAMALVSLIDFLMAENLARQEEQTARIAIGAGPEDVFRQIVAENGVWIALVAGSAYFSSGYIADLLLGVEPFASHLHALSADAVAAGLASAAALLAVAFVLSAGYASWFVSKTSRALAAAGGQPTRLARLTRATLLFVGAASLLLVFSLVGRYAGDARFTLKFENADALVVRAHTQAENFPYELALLDAIDALPGIQSSAIASMLPLDFPVQLTFARGKLRDEPGLEETPFYANSVTGGYFRTLGAPLLAGRPFDGEAWNEVVISRTAAIALAGDLEAALGRSVVFWRDQFDNMDFPEGFPMEVPAKTVVGVVEDIPYGDYAAAATRVIYDLRHGEARSNFQSFLITHAGAADSVLRMLRAAPIFDGWEVHSTTTPESRFREQFLARRSVEMILTGAATFALVLALAGIANSLARSLAARRSALGIHLALGATTFDLSRGYAGSAFGDLLLVTALVAALAYAAKLATPTLAELLDLWLLLPATLSLTAVCALVAHMLVRNLARRGALNALIQGAG